MSESSTLKELAENLRRRQEEQTAMMIEIEKENLRKLAESLRNELNSELNTIRGDISKTIIAANKAEEFYLNRANKIFQKSKAGLKNELEELEQEIEQMQREITRTKWKRWLIPSSVAASLMVGLAIGGAAIGKYAGDQIEKMRVSNIAKREIVVIGEKGLKLRNKPAVYQAQDGSWIVLYGGRN